MVIKDTSYGPLMTGIMVNEACDLEHLVWVADVDTKCRVADVSLFQWDKTLHWASLPWTSLATTRPGSSWQTSPSGLTRSMEGRTLTPSSVRSVVLLNLWMDSKEFPFISWPDSFTDAGLWAWLRPPAPSWHVRPWASSWPASAPRARDAAPWSPPGPYVRPPIPWPGASSSTGASAPSRRGIQFSIWGSGLRPDHWGESLKDEDFSVVTKLCPYKVI